MEYADFASTRAAVGARNLYETYNYFTPSSTITKETVASRYLVTGGAGFIGSHLVKQLLLRGDDVVVLDDFSTGRRENLQGLHGGTLEIIEGSVTDPRLCSRAIDGVDVVFHEAALGAVPRSVVDPGGTHHVNATGTLNILIAARDAEVRRVVYAASSSAYGNTETLPKEEGTLPLPLSPYAVAKLAGEYYCRAFTATYGLDTVSLRYFNVFGPRQEPNSQYAAVIPLFFAAALGNESPLIFGDGQQSRDFTFVDNVVKANLLAADGKGQYRGAVINVGTGSQTTINELWDLISGLTGVDIEPRYESPRPGDVRHSLASLSTAQQILDYSPEVDVREGLRRTVRWYKERFSTVTQGK